MTAIMDAPGTVHRSQQDLPFVDLGEGIELQLLQVDLANGLWVIRNRFQPGCAVQRHKHTGPVYAFTQSGSWHYVESADQVNTAGSYLYEPAGSVHTLVVPEANGEVTEVCFTIHGANLNLTPDDAIEMVIDAHVIRDVYASFCAEQHGLDDPPVVVVE